ncbi:MAG TPA: alpha/beta fold hydrolase [Gaiellaceae bacterium]|nr:alpha/beta fold hydrolase [Gaiellaceae bacterium]
MPQELHTLEVDDAELAYAVQGSGPLLVVGPRWVSHLEEEWRNAAARSFFEDLAKTYRVVRFDRLGCGLSQRELKTPPTIESESRQFEAVIDAEGGRGIVFAASCGCFASAQLAVRSPKKVAGIAFFGGYATRNDIPEPTKNSLIEFVRTNWTLAAQMLAGLFVPHASGDELAYYTRLQRKAASADASATFLRLDLFADSREWMQKVTVPTLVLHRRGDRTVPIARGRELAALLPNSRFVPLSGDSHLPWVDDRRELLRALAGFPHEETATTDDSPLTSRETEVLRLVSTGMSNREIASTLVLSEHTVHRHIANILRKLALTSRAAAAAHAARAGIL